METGRFFVGPDKQGATELFRQLNGYPILDDKTLLRLDLIALNNQGLDTVLETRSCILDEMVENVKIIMKETFRILNLM